MSTNPELYPGSVAHKFGPYVCKQRAGGDWVIDQLNRTTWRTRRIGTYATEAEARAALVDLRK